MQPKYSLLMALLCLGGPTLSHATDQFSADTSFVGKAEQASSQDMTDSSDAIAMTTNAALRTLAKRIHDDENSANLRLTELSVLKGWPAPTLDPPDRLRRYSDHRYVDRQIHATRNALAFYVEEAANGGDTDLQEFARSVVPALRQRLKSLRLLRTS